MKTNNQEVHCGNAGEAETRLSKAALMWPHSLYNTYTPRRSPHLLGFVKKRIFDFIHAGIRLDSQEVVVVHSFSVARKAGVKPKHTHRWMCSQSLCFHTDISLPVCVALGEQAQPALIAPDAGLTQTQLSLQLHGAPQTDNLHTEDRCGHQ